jgi:hypothetical protein
MCERFWTPPKSQTGAAPAAIISRGIARRGSGAALKHFGVVMSQNEQKSCLRRSIAKVRFLASSGYAGAATKKMVNRFSYLSDSG